MATIELRLATVEAAILENAGVLEKKFGGQRFLDALRDAVYPTVLKDLSRGEDRTRIPLIGRSGPAADLEGVQEDVVETFIGILSIPSPNTWYQIPLYWIVWFFYVYIRGYFGAQRFFSRQQLITWRRTTSNFEPRETEPPWYARYLPLSFLSHFGESPFSILAKVFVFVWWLFINFGMLVVSLALGDRAFFVLAIGVNIRFLIFLVAMLARGNITFRVVLQSAIVRGIGASGTILPYCKPAFGPDQRHLYGEASFTQTVLVTSLICNNLLFFHAEILYILAWLSLRICHTWSSPSAEDCQALDEMIERLRTHLDAFLGQKDENEHLLSCLSIIELDGILEIGDRLKSLMGTYRQPNTLIMILRQVRSSFRDIKTAMTWDGILNAVVRFLLNVPKLVVLVTFGIFAFLHIFPFSNRPLLLTTKIVWAVQIATRLLQYLPPWRSPIYMFTQGSYLVFGTLPQIAGVSFPIMKNDQFFDIAARFYGMIVLQIVATNWLAELPGDLMLWGGTRLSIIILRRLAAWLRRDKVAGAVYEMSVIDSEQV